MTTADFLILPTFAKNGYNSGSMNKTTSKIWAPHVRKTAVLLLSLCILCQPACGKREQKSGTPSPSEEHRVTDSLDFAEPPLEDLFKGRLIELKDQILQPGVAGILFSISLPQDYELTTEAPFSVDWKSNNESAVSFTATPPEIDLSKVSFPFKIPLSCSAGKAELTLNTVIYYCSRLSKQCFFDNVQVKISVTVQPGGSSEIPLTIEVKPKHVPSKNPLAEGTR